MAAMYVHLNNHHTLYFDGAKEVQAAARTKKGPKVIECFEGKNNKSAGSRHLQNVNFLQYFPWNNATKL